MRFSARVSKCVFAAVSLLAILLLVVFTSIPVYAQVSGATLSGTVTDQQGAVVSGAKVTVKALGTGIVTSAEPTPPVSMAFRTSIRPTTKFHSALRVLTPAWPRSPYGSAISRC